MSAFLDLLYPRSCLGCGAPAPATFRYICWDCWSDTQKVEPPFCRICGDPIAGAVSHDFVCFSCADTTPAFDLARSVVRYDGVVGEALKRLKYHRAVWLAPDLAELMLGCLNAEYPAEEFDWVVPVPLYHVRRRERGYNQSALLAHALARRISSKSSTRFVKRIRPTTTQTHLTAPQRLSNVHDAFESGRERKLAGQRVLLVDDVMTTGSTVNACARALKKGGAASVHVLTVARG
jgi:competence protein ComFC